MNAQGVCYPWNANYVQSEEVGSGVMRLSTYLQHRDTFFATEVYAEFSGPLGSAGISEEQCYERILAVFERARTRIKEVQRDDLDDIDIGPVGAVESEPERHGHG